MIFATIENHPEINSKRADYMAALAEMESAHWQYFPTPSLELQNDKGNTAAVVRIQQPLWAAGRIDATYGQATAKSRSAEISIAEAQYALSLRLISIWQSWRQAFGRKHVLNAGVDQLRLYAKSVERRILAGHSASADLQLVEARLAQLRSDLVAASATERSALAQLSQMIGKALDAENLAFGDPELAAEGVRPLEQIIEKSIAHSPTLRRMEAEKEAANHEIDQKKAALWPAVSLRGEHQTYPATQTNSSYRDSRVMIVAEFLPGAGLSARSSIQGSESRLMSLRESTVAARRELITRIHSDYEEYLSNCQRRQDLRQTIVANTQVLTSYERLFAAGKKSWLEVLNASRELVQINVLMADTDAAVIASYFRLRLHDGSFLQFRS